MYIFVNEILNVFLKDIGYNFFKAYCTQKVIGQKKTSPPTTPPPPHLLQKMAYLGGNYMRPGRTQAGTNS